MGLTNDHYCLRGLENHHSLSYVTISPGRADTGRRTTATVNIAASTPRDSAPLQSFDMGNRTARIAKFIDNERGVRAIEEYDRDVRVYC